MKQYFSILRYIPENKFDDCDIDDLKEATGDFFKQLNSAQYNIELDANKFAQNCMDINEILSESQYFLRVYEFGKKFREVRMKNSKEQKIENFLVALELNLMATL